MIETLKGNYKNLEIIFFFLKFIKKNQVDNSLKPINEINSKKFLFKSYRDLVISKKKQIALKAALIHAMFNKQESVNETL